MPSWLVQLLISLAMSLITYLLTPKNNSNIDPATLEEFEVPTAREGREIPVIFGTKYVTGANVVWYGDLRTEEVKKGGGKK